MLISAITKIDRDSFKSQEEIASYLLNEPSLLAASFVKKVFDKFENSIEVDNNHIKLEVNILTLDDYRRIIHLLNRMEYAREDNMRLSLIEEIKVVLKE